MKYRRLFLGVLAILAALWVLVGEQMSAASSNAFLNAQVITLRANVSGTLALAPRTLGAAVADGETLASLRDPLVDTVRLQDLTMEATLKSAAIASLGNELAAFEAQRDQLRAREAAFRAARVQEIETRLDHARTRLALLEEEGPASEKVRLISDAVDADNARLPGEPLLPELAIQHARERVSVLEIALASARKGVFLGDGYNDAPNAEQRATELESEIDLREAALARAEAELDAIETRIAREKVRVGRLSGGAIKSPVDGLYWEILQADGVTVQRGDPILRLVDCGSAVVSLSVSENVYNTLRLGQAAKFRFNDDERVFDGSIIRLGGAGARSLYDNMAVAPSKEHLERFDVTMQVPALAMAPDLACAIGRTGRVFFDRRPMDWLRNLI